MEFLFLGGLTSIVPIGLLVLVVLVLAGGRGEVDPTGRRTFALYVSTVSFVAIFTALVAAVAIVGQVTDSFVDEDEVEPSMFFDDDVFLEEDFDGEEDFFSFEDVEEDETDRIVRTSVQAALIGGAAGIVLAFHLRRRSELTAEPGFGTSAAWRVDRAFLFAVCFTAVLLVLFGGGTGAYGLFRILAPGITGSGDDTLERQEGLAQLLTLGFLAATSFGIFRLAWQGTREEEPVGSPPGGE
ncbi:MAG: hypothetical protein M5U14_13430 [Acidimicrobiia bacterium]|nr:hypothetical protein [Acidimicrobiia bacterium]